MAQAPLPFVKVSSFKQKSALLSQIHQAEGSSTFGIQKGPQISMNVLSVNELKLFIELEPGVSEKDVVDRNGIFHFLTHEGVVFVHTKVVKKNAQLIIDLEMPEFYTMQRRDNFRSPVPEDILGNITFMNAPMNPNKPINEIPLHLLDISVHGCAVIIGPSDLTRWPKLVEFSLAQPIEIKLNVLDRTTFHLHANIKNIKKESGSIRIGMEFDFNRTPDLAKKIMVDLQLVILEIHRTAFTRFRDFK